MAHISTYSKRAKRIRKLHPNMSWQNAMRQAAKGGGTTHKKKHRVSGTVGSTAVGKVHKRKTRTKKTTWFGATTASTGDVMKVGELALQFGVGLAVTYMAVQPLERKIVDKWPKAHKFLGWGEILVGGLVAVKSKNAWAQGAGMALMFTGVNTVGRSLRIYKPMDTLGDYTEIKIPIDHARMSGLIRDNRSYVRSEVVAGGRSVIHNNDGLTNTPWVGSYDRLENSPVIGGDDDFIFAAKGLYTPSAVNYNMPS